MNATLKQGSLEMPSADVQRLWFATLKKEWTSLAVLPSHPGGSAVPLARALAKVAAMQKDAPIKLITAENTDLAGASRLIIEMTSHTAQGGLAIIALDSVISNPAGIPVALAADAALLSVELREADVDSGRRTLELLGEAKFVGAVSYENELR
ncbi:MAG: hypothetical protein IPJ65_30040 [Archangiaceae bacterium]|nr:hypothetical protein [Archangiaceae bacterium]